MKNNNFVFFGTSTFSVSVLDSLKESGYLPSAVVTFPDKPQGRKLIPTANIVKEWALQEKIPVIEVSTFKDGTAVETLKNINADLFVVASFGKILPDSVIYMPPFKTLNVHPSLLPKLRGPAPIQEAIIREKETGVTIMRLNEKMDEGPLLAQKKVAFSSWPLPYSSAEKILGNEGGKLLAQVIPGWVSGQIKETDQDHSQATYTRKIDKKDADITNDPPEIALRKINAYEVWPRARKGDLIIKKAHLAGGDLVIDTVVPPGKNEMSYEDYLRGQKTK